MRLKMRFKRATFLTSQISNLQSLISAQRKVSNQHLLTHSVSGHFKWFNLNPTTTILWVGPIISALQMGATSQRVNKCLWSLPQTWGGGGEELHTWVGAGPWHTPRLFPWVGIAQALIFTQGGLGTQLTFPLRGPIFVYWIITGHFSPAWPPRTTAPRSRGPRLGSGWSCTASDFWGWRRAGPAPPGSAQGLAGAHT